MYTHYTALSIYLQNDLCLLCVHNSLLTFSGIPIAPASAENGYSVMSGFWSVQPESDSYPALYVPAACWYDGGGLGSPLPPTVDREMSTLYDIVNLKIASNLVVYSE